MKKITISAIFLFAWVSFLCAQDPRAYLKDKLILKYVASPNAASPSHEVLSNTEIYAGTFNGNFWSNANMNGTKALVKALLCATAQGGDVQLQRLASEIIKIRNKPVEVFLLDDLNITLAATATSNYADCQSGGKFWPCASGLPQSNPNAGKMYLGAHFFSNYNPMSWPASRIRAYRYGVFLHESTHTQDNVSWRAHLHYLGGRWFSYGSDGTHYLDEILPDVNATYMEAIANAFAMYYDQDYYNDTFFWFAQGGNMTVEHPPASGPPGFTSWQPTFQARSITPLRTRTVSLGTTPPSSTTYSDYRMDQVPLDIIMNNENILAVMLESVRRYGGTTPYMTALKTSNGELFNSPANPVATLFRNMCRVGLPSGVRDITDLNASTGNAAYVFPLALADFFTGYQSQTKAQFKQIFSNQAYMDPWIDSYWDHHRATVMAAAPLTCGIGDLVNLIKQALGMS